MVSRMCREERLLLLPAVVVVVVVCGWAFRDDARVGVVVVVEEHDFEFGDVERRGDVRLESRGDDRSSEPGCTGVSRGGSALAREGPGRCLRVSGACKRAR